MCETPKTIDIIELVKSHPLYKLPSNDTSILVNKIKEKFPQNEQQLFIANFYCYLNYDTNKDFVVELDNIWKWLGFGRINEAKRLLINNFEENVDYKVEKLALLDGKASFEHGGQNKENILLTIRCFKKLCLKTKTKKSDEIHDYYISLEEMINETVYEQSEQLRNQLQLKDREIINTLIKAYDLKPTVYIGIAEKNILKFGSSDKIKERCNTHRREISKEFDIIYVIETKYNKELENMIKNQLKERIISKEYLGKNQTELIQLTDSFTLQKLINQVVGFEKILSDKTDLIELVKENSCLKERLSKYENVEEIPPIEQLIKDNEELKDIHKISDKYNVSDNTVKKWFNDKDEKFVDNTKNYCIKCNTELKWKKSVRCSSCSAKEPRTRKVQDRPSLEQLLNEVKESNFVEVGKKYNVSDNAIRKWIKSYDPEIDTHKPINPESYVNVELKCLDCKKEVRKDVKRCRSCASKESNKDRKKVQDRPSLEQLLKEVNETSFVQVGKKYGVTDNAIRKWIKSYDPDIDTKIKKNNTNV